MIALTETWCTQEEIKTLLVYDYVLAGNYCRSTTRGGGTAIFVRKDVEWKEKTALKKLAIESAFDVCTSELQVSSFSLTITCLYRAPSADINVFCKS